MEHLPVLIPIPLLLAAFVALLFSMWRQTAAYVVALCGVTISLAAATVGLIRVLQEGTMHYYFGGWLPPLGIEYVLDNLSAFMALLICLIGLLAVIYSRRSFLQEMPDKLLTLYPLLLLLLAGMVGIVITGDLFNLYVFLEIASLSAYALMAIGNKKAPVAAFRYLIMGTLGACFYLLGVGFLYFSTGSLNMADIAQILPGLYGSRAIIAAVSFIVIGLALKMALFPLHFWLPDAYTYAPSAVTALVAPTMTKVSAYVLVRMFLSVFSPHYLADTLPIAMIIGWLAAAGIIVGSIMAIAQNDLRRMLAYSSVAQIGYIALGIGLANPLGLIGGLLHIMNHAFMKGCLFMVAGAVRYQTGVWDISRFAGLGRRMPVTMAAFTIAALSMIGIPPACGFFSKWYLVLGCIDAHNWIFLVVIIISSLLNVVYFFRILEKVYIAPPSGEAALEQASDPPLEMRVPIMVLAAGIIILGLINVLIVTNVLWPMLALGT
ncbi:monovalent cation/H+ antiporter subunit D family protein [Chloroflexota bacterium]